MKKNIFARPKSKTGGSYKFDICLGDPADGAEATKIGSYTAGKPPRDIVLDRPAYDKALKGGYTPTSPIKSVVAAMS
jgi:hypothetical protein